MLSKEHLTTFWWVLFILIAIVLTILFLVPLYKKLKQEQENVKKLRGELKTVQQENNRLRIKIDALEHNPEEVERTAIEKFNMARKGVTVWITTPEKEK